MQEHRDQVAAPSRFREDPLVPRIGDQFDRTPRPSIPRRAVASSRRRSCVTEDPVSEEHAVPERRRWRANGLRRELFGCRRWRDQRGAV